MRGTHSTATYQQPMERASEIIADLDAFVRCERHMLSVRATFVSVGSHYSNSIVLSHHSMAHVSANWRYTRPQLTEPGVGDIIIKVRSCNLQPG